MPDKDYGIPEEDATKIRKNGNLEGNLLLKLHDKIDVAIDKIDDNKTQIAIGKREREELFSKVDEISKTQLSCTAYKAGRVYDNMKKSSKALFWFLTGLIFTIISAIIGVVANGKLIHF